MRRLNTWAIGAFFVVCGLAALTGCGAPGEGAGASGTASGEGNQAQQLKVGIVFDKGGLGDRSFNDSAWRGIQRAEAELGIEASKVESKEEKDYETNLAAMADRGMDLVIAVGINQGKALEKVAREYPDTKFAIVDANVEAPNVRSLLFKEEEGSFLVGYLAGLMSQTGKVGFVGGMELDLIKKFEYGFAAGVRSANPSAEVLDAKYTGSWDNIDLAKVAANVLFDRGADIVYHAAGRAGLGVIRAAEERGLYAIGVDSDQDDVAPGRVLTSMIKRVDVAVFETIKAVQAGNFEAGPQVFDLKADGVGTSPFTHTREAIGEANLAKLEEMASRVKSGEVQVPATRAEYEAFVAALAR